jgi:hypothetical protein
MHQGFILWIAIHHLPPSNVPHGNIVVPTILTRFPTICINTKDLFARHARCQRFEKFGQVHFE